MSAPNLRSIRFEPSPSQLARLDAELTRRGRAANVAGRELLAVELIDGALAEGRTAEPATHHADGGETIELMGSFAQRVDGAAGFAPGIECEESAVQHERARARRDAAADLLEQALTAAEAGE